MTKADLPELWERQPKESEQAYYAFCLYRDQDAPRGYAGVVSELGKSKTLIDRWGSKWFWRERARAWDRHQEDLVRRDQVRATKQMARRQARDAEAFQALLIAPVEMALLKLQNPATREEIANLPLADLVALSVLTGRLFPRIAHAERMARGAPIQDLSQFLDDETGDLKDDATDPAEEWDFFRGAVAALEQATGQTLQLPPGAPDA